LPEVIREFGEVDPEAPEVTETSPSWWERLSAERRRLAILVRYAVYRVARDEDAVIIGLGSSFLLRGLSHVLRVLFVAPPDVRIERIVAAMRAGPGPVDRTGGAELVRHSDHERAGYTSYLHHADWLDVHAYDLVLNTANLDVEQAVDLLASTLQCAPIGPTIESRRRIEELALASRVEALLVTSPELYIGQVQVTADDGTVTIAGEVVIDEDRERAVELALTVPGVEAVVDQVRLQPPPMEPI
jgi:cytidylate kinase